MEGFSIREATPKDKQAVLDCHQNVYDGLDYLPEFYDYFMTAQQIIAFVLLHGEKIVSTCYSVVYMPMPFCVDSFPRNVYVRDKRDSFGNQHFVEYCTKQI